MLRTASASASVAAVLLLAACGSSPTSPSGMSGSAGSVQGAAQPRATDMCVSIIGSEGRVAGLQMDLNWNPLCLGVEGAVGDPASCVASPSTDKTVETKIHSDSSMRALFLSVSDTAPVPDGQLFCCAVTVAPSQADSCCSTNISNLILAGSTDGRIGRVYDPNIAVQVSVDGVPCAAFTPPPNTTEPQPPIQTPTPTPTATVQPGRFVDNGDGTITDRESGLMWEKKTGTPSVVTDCWTRPCSDPHDVNNAYSWSVAPFAWEGDPDRFGTAAVGTVFTDFLPRLNGTLCDTGACAGLAGYRDWRLPTLSELQTIVDMSAPGCGSSACIDPAFGPTGKVDGYRSSTDNPYNPHYVEGVGFMYGGMGSDWKASPGYVRAVRGG